jgi:hypothetical protein
MEASYYIRAVNITSSLESIALKNRQTPSLQGGGDVDLGLPDARQMTAKLGWREKEQGR